MVRRMKPSLVCRVDTSHSGDRGVRTYPHPGGALCAEFDDCEVIVGPNRTTLRAEIPDQSAVVGLVLRISGLGLELIEMHRVAW